MTKAATYSNVTNGDQEQCSAKHCHRRPTTLHFLDGNTGRIPLTMTRPRDVIVRLACSRHDPGGYWVDWAQYARDPAHFAEHLRESKAWRGNVALKRAGFQ